MKIVGKFIMAGILLYLSYHSGTSLQPEFYGGSVVILISLAIEDLLIPLVSSFKELEFNIMLFYLIIKGQKIRFSMAYQFIIKVDDDYLLVKNSNWNSYQHVGGKYKAYESAKSKLLEMEASEDAFLKKDEIKKDDLALFIPASKAKEFLAWFQSMADREISHYREFYEELIKGKNGNGVLTRENFIDINYRFLRTIRTPLRRVPPDTGWQCWELLQYDVLELIPTPKQEEELRKLKSSGDSDYIKWANDCLIDNCGHDLIKKSRPYDISLHTKWVKNLDWSKE